MKRFGKYIIFIILAYSFTACTEEPTKNEATQTPEITEQAPETQYSEGEEVPEEAEPEVEKFVLAPVADEAPIVERTAVAEVEEVPEVEVEEEPIVEEVVEVDPYEGVSDEMLEFLNNEDLAVGDIITLGEFIDPICWVSDNSHKLEWMVVKVDEESIELFPTAPITRIRNIWYEDQKDEVDEGVDIFAYDFVEYRFPTIAEVDSFCEINYSVVAPRHEQLNTSTAGGGVYSTGITCADSPNYNPIWTSESDGTRRFCICESYSHIVLRPIVTVTR